MVLGRYLGFGYLDPYNKGHTCRPIALTTYFSTAFLNCDDYGNST